MRLTLVFLTVVCATLLLASKAECRKKDKGQGKELTSQDEEQTETPNDETEDEKNDLASNDLDQDVLTEKKLEKMRNKAERRRLRQARKEKRQRKNREKQLSKESREEKKEKDKDRVDREEEKGIESQVKDGGTFHSGDKHGKSESHTGKEEGGEAGEGNGGIKAKRGSHTVKDGHHLAKPHHKQEHHGSEVAEMAVGDIPTDTSAGSHVRQDGAHAVHNGHHQVGGAASPHHSDVTLEAEQQIADLKRQLEDERIKREQLELLFFTLPGLDDSKGLLELTEDSCPLVKDLEAEIEKERAAKSELALMVKNLGEALSNMCEQAGPLEGAKDYAIEQKLEEKLAP